MKVINSKGVVVEENVFIVNVVTKTEFMEKCYTKQNRYKVTDEVWEEFCDYYYNYNYGDWFSWSFSRMGEDFENFRKRNPELRKMK